MNTRRIKAVAISFDLLMELMRQDYEIRWRVRTTKGVPTTARYISSYTDWGSGCGYLVFEDESFEPVDDAAPIPILRVEHERLDPPGVTLP